MNKKVLVILWFLAIASVSYGGQQITDSDWVKLNMAGIPGANQQVTALGYCKGSIYMNGYYSVIGGDSASGIVRWKGRSIEMVGQRRTTSTMLVTADETVYACISQDTSGGKMPYKLIKRSGDTWADFGTGLTGEALSIAIDSAKGIYVALKIRSGYSYVYDIMKWDGTSWNSLKWSYGGPIRKLCFGPDSTLYVAGNFGRGIAQYTSGNWSSISGGVFTVTGYANPPPADVWDIKFDKNGTMFIAGDFDSANGLYIGGVAKYNGTKWVQVGTQRSEMKALAFDSSGQLFAAGPAVYRLANNKWENIGTVGRYEYVSALEFDDKNNLWAGGYFTTLGSTAIHCFGYWDGITWNTPLPILESTIWAFVLDSKGNLYAGGNFTLADGIGVNHIAKWDGSKWMALGTGVTLDTAQQYAVVRSLAVDENDNIYVGGCFSKAGGIPVRNIARWNGTRWDSLGKGMNKPVNSLANDKRGTLYAVGDFDSAGDFSVTGMAQWNSGDWYPVQAKEDGVYRPQTVTADNKGNVYAATDLYDGRIWNNNIGLWKNDQWKALNPPGFSTFSDVSSLVCDAAGNLYASGDFSGEVIKWNGITWTILGTGITATAYSGGVRSLAVDRNGNIYAAGGGFTSAGGTPAKNIAKWNGSSWEALGSGFGYLDGIFALQCTDSFMYVGGNFSTAGIIKSPCFTKVNIHNIPTGTLPVSVFVPSSRKIGYRVKGNCLLITNGTPADKIEFYSFSGKLVRKQTGCAPVNIQTFSSQPLIMRIVRDGKAVLTEMKIFK